MAAELIPFVFVLASVGLYVSLQLVSDNWHKVAGTVLLTGKGCLDIGLSGICLMPSIP